MTTQTGIPLTDSNDTNYYNHHQKLVMRVTTHVMSPTNNCVCVYVQYQFTVPAPQTAGRPRTEVSLDLVE